MLQNARVTAFTVSKLLRENQQGVKSPPHPNPTQIRVKFNLGMRGCGMRSGNSVVGLVGLGAEFLRKNSLGL